jgi:hypothetical protein
MLCKLMSQRVYIEKCEMHVKNANRRTLRSTEISHLKSVWTKSREWLLQTFSVLLVQARAGQTFASENH